jgi:signal peptidase I
MTLVLREPETNVPLQGGLVVEPTGNPLREPGNPLRAPGNPLREPGTAATTAAPSPRALAPEARTESQPQPARRSVATPRVSGRRWAFELMIGTLLMAAFHLFVVQISVVKGHSMEPSLRDGDRLVVDRVAPSLGELTRGDVVVMRYPRNPAVDFVKRVVGLPGDRIALKHGQLWVNGAMAPDEWTCIADLETTAEVDVPDGCYFVLGDNRPISCDSREFGLVPESLLRGRVRARFWPLDRVAVF